uniref:FHF complex subunit HOOK interacting protein 2B n=1 Tax=Lates calcarifer TaxID=8187 RepID=A0A4W6F9I4_LATCA
METFSKLTRMLLHALETREPTVDLLDSFVDHWKSITNYYIETTDDSRPVRQTEIPWRLRQMLDILVYEEKQQGVEETGACLEYLLQHKLLETLCTLGKAQYPPGMSQQVLLFFCKFLSQMQRPVLHLVNVYRPVQKLIRLCALPGSQTEKEEAQFLLVICSRIKQDPDTLRHVLEVTSKTPPSSSQSDSCSSSLVQSESSASSPIQSESSLLSALLHLKAYESLLLVSGLQSGSSGETLTHHTQLGELLAGRLLELYSLLPMESLDPGLVQSCSDLRSESPASDHVTNFFSWFDFLDHLMREAPQVLSVKLAQCVRQVWLSNVLQPQLLHTCEQMVLVSTSVLCAAVRLVQSLSLLDQLVHFLLRTESLSHLLLQRCDHISDQISMASLSLVEELLQKPHRDILDVLVLGFLQSRSYLSPPAAGVDDRHTEVNETGDFLCLVPVQVRSAQLLQEGGYESYVHDAHTLVSTHTLTHTDLCEGEEFFEGHLFKVLFDRLGRILEQPYELNLQLTAVLSRLSAFSHPLLHEYLLNPYIHLSRCSRSLFSVLIRVMGELMQRIQQISNLTDRLLNTRRHLLEHLTLLRGVIVLEEFCKELAAIAFVKLPLDQN